MGWITATGHWDPYGKWLDESFAHDGSVESAAFTDPAIPDGSWSSPLNLTIGSMLCSAIRFWANPSYPAAFTIVDVRVYWGGAWHIVHYGAFAKNTWVEVSLGGGIYSVTEVSLNFYNNGPGSNTGKINEVQFFAPSLPTVTIQAVSDIEEITATGNGNITATGGANCTKRGVCWNTTGNPTVADSKSEETGSFGTGAFSRPMTGLTRGQKYYVKAYAYHLVGYGYSSQVEFVTYPAVTTQDPSNITRANPSTITANGLIEFGGTEIVTTRGFKYGLTSTGDSDASSTGSFGEGTYNESISGLDSDTTYFVRAYVIDNWVGTKYGSWLEFKTAYPYGPLKTEIKAEATASSGDIAKVGGKRSLTIKNHLIQTQTLADLIADAYLAEYKDQKTKFIVTRPTPAPYEIGDTIKVQI